MKLSQCVILFFMLLSLAHSSARKKLSFVCKMNLNQKSFWASQAQSASISKNLLKSWESRDSRILRSLHLDNFHFLNYWTQKITSAYARLPFEQFRENASCSCTITIPCPHWNNIMVCMYSSFLLFVTILTCFVCNSYLEMTCSYVSGW